MYDSCQVRSGGIGAIERFCFLFFLLDSFSLVAVVGGNALLMLLLSQPRRTFLE